MPKYTLTTDEGVKINRRQFLICLGAVLLWITFIFCHSLQPAAVSSSKSTYVLTLFQRFFPFGFTEHFIRKMAHFTEFGVLGVLSGALFCGCCQRLRTVFLFSVMTGMSTALCDETIQLFVDGRSGQISDVWIDVAGTAAGAVLALSIRAVWRRREFIRRGKRHDQDTGGTGNY